MLCITCKKWEKLLNVVSIFCTLTKVLYFLSPASDKKYKKSLFEKSGFCQFFDSNWVKIWLKIHGRQGHEFDFVKTTKVRKALTKAFPLKFDRKITNPRSETSNFLSLKMCVFFFFFFFFFFDVGHRIGIIVSMWPLIVTRTPRKTVEANTRAGVETVDDRPTLRQKSRNFLSRTRQSAHCKLVNLL